MKQAITESQHFGGIVPGLGGAQKVGHVFWDRGAVSDGEG